MRKAEMLLAGIRDIRTGRLVASVRQGEGGMNDLLHEWVAIDVDWESCRKLDALGISWENQNRCGNPLPVRVQTDATFFEPEGRGGRVMLVQPCFGGPIPSIFDFVDAPCLLDMIAYSPREPNRWYWRRGECGLVLGDEALSYS